MDKFDLHTHSYMSDGTDSPAQLIANAKTADVKIVAITDHDTTAGTDEAIAAGVKYGVKVISGIEFDVECEETSLHILGLGVNINNPSFAKATAQATAWRNARNEGMIKKLRDMNLPIDDAIEPSGGSLSRLHMAKALVKKGYAKTKADAFDKYLLKGRGAYVRAQNISRRDAIDVIHAAGGIAVLAHPCKLKCNPSPLIEELVSYGIDGLEAFYPTSTEGEKMRFISLAQQYKILITEGSDYHGANRPESQLGCAYEDSVLLLPIFDKISHMI